MKRVKRKAKGKQRVPSRHPGMGPENAALLPPVISRSFNTCSTHRESRFNGRSSRSTASS
jgi:hypothetical protein